MILCFASLAKILRLCSKNGVSQKVLCGRIFASINWEYGTELEDNDTNVSRILSCNSGLSPKVTSVISERDIDDIVDYIAEEVIPLLDQNMYPVIMYALKDLIKNSDPEIIIGSRNQVEIITSGNDEIVRTIADILYYTVAYVDNKKGKESIQQINEEYIHEIQEKLKQSVISPKMSKGEEIDVKGGDGVENARIEVEEVTDDEQPKVEVYEAPFTDPSTQQQSIAQFNVIAKDNGIAIGQVFGGLTIGKRGNKNE